MNHLVCRMDLWACIALGCWLLAGCSKAGPPPAAISMEQAAPAMDQAFKEAQPEVQTAAQEAATALRNQDDPRALASLNELTARPELTPEQRQAAIQSLMALTERLRQAAASGNPAAEKLLEAYRATK